MALYNFTVECSIVLRPLTDFCIVVTKSRQRLSTLATSQIDSLRGWPIYFASTRRQWVAYNT